jgi:ribosomal protein L9
MFGRSLFAAKLFFFFFTALVSAKDEYEQYFLLSKKKNVEYTEKISSVFMLVVLIDEENLLDKTLLQSFRRRTCVST